MRGVKPGVSLFITFVMPICAQTALNLSQDLVRLGIATANMLPNQQGQDATSLFTKGMQYAYSSKIAKVTADPGSYYFLTRAATGCGHITVQTNDLTVDFQGSDLYFADPLNSALCLVGKNITLQNLTIDYLKLPWTQLVVTGVDTARQQISWTAQPGWQKPNALNPVAQSPGWLTIFRGGRVFHSLIFVQQPFADDKATLLSDFEYLPLIRPGDIATLELTNGAIALGGECESCTLRNIRIYSSPQGSVWLYGHSNLIERLYVIPKPGTDRLLSAHADIHLIATGPNNVIRLSRAIRKGDDGFSPVSQRFGRVSQRLDNRTLQVQGLADRDGLAVGPALRAGSIVEFQRVEDGAILGRAAIVSQTPPQPATVTLPGGAQVTGRQVNLTLDRDVSVDLVGSKLYSIDPDRRGAGLLLERNTVQQQTSGSAFQLYGLMNATVRGNYVSRSAWTGVWIDSNTIDNYGNVPNSSGVTVTRNVIDRPNSWLSRRIDIAQFAGIQALAWLPTWSPMRVSPMRNITISNNFVADPRRSGIWIGNTTDGSVSGNYLFNPNNDPAPAYWTPPADALRLSTSSTPLAVDASQNVSTSNNTIDETSGRVWVTDAQYRQLSAYAPGATIRLNAFDLGKLANPSITFTDADGVLSSAKIQGNADHWIDVTVPAYTSLGGAFLTVLSGSAKYLGTLFVDSQDNFPAVNDCTYEFSPSSKGIPPNGIVSILVVTQAGCEHNATSSDPSAKVTGPKTGTGVVTVTSKAPNTVDIGGIPMALTFAPSVQAIVDSWGYTAGIAPGTWVTIGGVNLGPASPQIWKLSGSSLPLTLGGSTVTFNGIPAALLYASTTQINALVPASVAPGPVRVIVQSAGIASSPFTIPAAATQPAAYALPNTDGSTFFVTAALAGTGTLVGNRATDPRVARGAYPGETLDLYMIGLGATADASKFVTDRSFSGAFPVNAQVGATVGGKSAAVQFAGLTSPGLYLVRVTIPSDLPSGPQPIQITADGGQTRPGLMLAVESTPGSLP